MVFVDTPIDEDPIDISPPPDISIEEYNAYQNDMGSAYEAWFKAQVAQMFGAIDTWFETPADTAADYWHVLQEAAHGQLKVNGQSQVGIDIKTLAAFAPLQAIVFQRYVGRLQAADAGRQRLMHQIMEGQIKVLAYKLNQLYALTTGINKTLSNEINRAVAGESAQRKATEAALLKVIQSTESGLVENLHRWVQNDIAVPLLKEIADNKAEVNRTILTTEDTLHHNILSEVEPALAALGVAQAAQATQLSALQQESDECVKPMCETQGPNSNLGKLFKLLKAFSFVGLIAFLESQDIKSLEHLAQLLYGYEGEVGDWVGTKILDELQSES